MNKQYQMPMFEIDKVISDFRVSLTSGLYSPQDIVPTSYIQERMERLKNPIQMIKGLARSSKLSINDVASSFEEEPHIIEVIKLLLALPRDLEFRDGRRVLYSGKPAFRDYYELAEIVDEIGFWKLLSKADGNIESLLEIALIHEGKIRRQGMISRGIEHEIEEIILGTTKIAINQNDLELTLGDLSEIRFTFKTRRTIDYIIKASNTPVAAIDVLLLTNPGGSQLFDVRQNYPNLQQELNSIPMKLILIADGPGMNRLSDSALVEMFSSVYRVMSIKQAKSGMLLDSLIEAATGKQTRVQPIDRVIESILFSGKRVLANELPKDYDNARLALAEYMTANPEFDLVLSSGGNALSWNKAAQVSTAVRLKDNYAPGKALKLFSDLMDGKFVGIDTNDSLPGVVGTIELNLISSLPKNMVVLACEEGLTTEIFRELAKKSLQTFPDAKITCLITPDKNISQSLPDKNLQSRLPANVIILDTNDLMYMARSKRVGQEILQAIILEQSDLTKISPFVLNSATPRRMYFGREEEEAILLSTLATNSVAILGSRRIGKTSLLKNVRESLFEAEFSPHFLDCQTVSNWESFGEMAHRQWDVEVPSNFEPQHLYDLVKQIKRKTSKGVVILLDEIDQLLNWDMVHEEDQVPEAFFRTCRAISQNGDAQFVFSGERVIARKLWDPHSPHWNFCRPLPLHQLDENASGNLILEPLQSLQIQIRNITKFSKEVWRLTSGHPQIIQFLGDRLVNLVNQRPPTERNEVSIDDVHQIESSFEYKDHYITTYWGQSTDLEKLISLLVIGGKNQLSEIMTAFRKQDVHVSESSILEALRMLELYGIIKQNKNRHTVRSTWFFDALNVYGDFNETIERYWRLIQ